MKRQLTSLSLLIGMLTLTGCGAGTFLSSSGNPQNLSGNWQLATVNTSPSSQNNVILLGGLVSDNEKVTGSFRFSNLNPANNCGPADQVVNVSGVVDYSNPAAQVLNITSSPFAGGAVLTASVALSARQSGGNGSVKIAGGTCSFSQSSAVATQFPAISGTFAGQVVPMPGVTNNAAITPGNATLNLTQSTVPNADGQFLVSGSIHFTGGTCASTALISGTTSGPLVRLTAAMDPSTSAIPVTFSGTNAPLTNQAPTPQLQASGVLYYPAPCTSGLQATATYTGALLKQ